MTGGFSVLAAGSSNQAVSMGVCSESTRVMSCLVVLFLLNTFQNGREKKDRAVHTNSTEPRVNQRIKRNQLHQCASEL